MTEINSIVVTEEMRDAGNEVASYCMDATIQKSFGEFNIENFPYQYHKLLELYVNDKIDSVEVIFIAMTEAGSKD